MKIKGGAKFVRSSKGSDYDDSDKAVIPSRDKRYSRAMTTRERQEYKPRTTSGQGGSRQDTTNEKAQEVNIPHLHDQDTARKLQKHEPCTTSSQGGSRQETTNESVRELISLYLHYQDVSDPTMTNSTLQSLFYNASPRELDCVSAMIMSLGNGDDVEMDLFDFLDGLLARDESGFRLTRVQGVEESNGDYVGPQPSDDVFSGKNDSHGPGGKRREREKRLVRSTDRELASVPTRNVRRDSKPSRRNHGGGRHAGHGDGGGGRKPSSNGSSSRPDAKRCGAHSRRHDDPDDYDDYDRY